MQAICIKLQVWKRSLSHCLIALAQAVAQNFGYYSAIFFTSVFALTPWLVLVPNPANLLAFSNGQIEGRIKSACSGGPPF